MYKFLLIFSIFLCFSSTLFSMSEHEFNSEYSSVNTNVFDNTFIKNEGQWDKDILFVGFSKGITLILKKDGLYIDAYQKEKINDEDYIKKGNLIKYNFLNSNMKEGINSIIEGKSISQHKTNFIYGKDQSKWQYGVKHYRNIIQKNIYDNIDLNLTFDNGSPRYDFIVNPGADLSKLQIQLEGAEILSNNQKELTFNTSIGNLYNGKLKTYQIVNGKETIVDSKFEFYNNQFRFKISDYNKNLPLIIDPIVYATYLGGNSNDEVNSVVRLSDEKFAIVGSTESMNFATTTGAYQTTINGGRDVFMIVYHNYGRFVVPEYATFLGGAGNDRAVALSVDRNNNIYFSGNTNSNDFPTTANAFKATNAGANDGFFAKFDGTTITPIFMSYIGGSDNDVVTDMHISPTGQIYLVGQTFSTNFPKSGGISNNTNRGLGDGFVAMVNATGIDLGFSNFFGGTGEDIINAIDVDSQDAIYIAGATKSTNIPTVPIPSGGFSPDSPYQAANNGGWDAFVVKYNKGGASIYSSTYFGGSADDYGTGVLSNTDGTITFAGYTAKESIAKPSFPSKNPYQATHGGGIDAFIGKLDLIRESMNRNRQDILFTTYFGGRSDDYVSKLRRNEISGSIVLYGRTNSTNLPLVASESDKLIGNFDFYIAEFNNAASNLTYCTYLGTKGEDIPGDFKYDIDGHYYVVGSTKSKDFVNSENSAQIGYGGGDTDGFVMKVMSSELTISTPSGGTSYCPGQEINIVWTAGNLDKTKGFKVSYYRNSDKVLNTIADNVLTENYRWTIPQGFPTADDYVIAVTHISGAYDIINSPFKVAVGGVINGIAIEGENPVDSICEGGSISIKVDASGQDIKYQWRFKGQNINGQTTNTLTLNNLTPAQAGDYDVVINASCTNNLASSKVNIKVLSNPNITTQPTSNIDIFVGDKFELTTSATGSNVKYQWQKDGENIGGATTNKYTVTNAQVENSGKYKCVITGTCGSEISTNETTVKVEISGSVSENEFNNDFMKVKSFEDNLYIELLQSINGSLYIVNSNGVILDNLLNGNINNQTLNYNTNALNSGVYWLILEKNNKIDKFKFIVTK